MSRSQVKDNHAAMHLGLRWRVPERFNIAQVCCGRWAADTRVADRAAILVHEPGQAASSARHFSYRELQSDANRLSNALSQWGVARGERVAIVLGQRIETAVAYMAVLQMGAVGMPLSALFGPDALEFRLQDSEASVVICDESSLQAVLALRASCPTLGRVVAVGVGGASGAHAWAEVLAAQSDRFEPVQTRADDPAVLIYTSGTTGNPKGALIPHQAMIGNLSGFVASQNWFGFGAANSRRGRHGESAAVFWSPADWAWTGGLMDALLPTLYFGRTIVAYRGRFDPMQAFELLQTHRITHTFLFPTALKAMMKSCPRPQAQFELHLQAIMSAGEAVGDAVFAYCKEELGVVVNEMFGQTEINYIVGNCAMQAKGLKPLSGVGWPARPGSMGKAYPGHRVAVIDDDGEECAVGVAGDVAVHRLDVHGQPDPVFFLGYWKNEAATRAKYTGDWCRTGDLAIRDADGYLWYQGRADDVFKAAGYRIGPGEIENCLVKHVAVANAAVVPKPDLERGALVKAYVVLAAQALAERQACQAQGAKRLKAHDAELIANLQAHVRGKLAPYEYPKEIEFIEALPMTTTGKVQRRVLRLQEDARWAARPSNGTS